MNSRSLFLVVSMALLAASAVLVVNPANAVSAIPRPAPQTLTGVVSDSFCGTTHSMKNMTAADCTRMCVKAGLKYALVVGADVYALQGHDSDLQRLAGETVMVKGSVNGKTVTIDSVVRVKKP